ncbi:hypothetical protein [Methylobacterium nonmethylotrophicum]|uniref:Uncharacterized protein n=1 Tax=Methylobacterium nonmethylotrophicum TaxID=1141884 RepID=A0A4Z0NTF4_9HYPH|nr:hypothetical protein [Methylobacterium nonmethylotrophicum]TGD99745.1 hypothetical protein EU555_11270 [Methylobacterium nonmethylotrophicum]
MTTPSHEHVYYNRSRKLWSIRSNGIVIGHAPSLALAGCVLHAGESARLRCVSTGQRDVHAWIKGTLADAPRAADAVRIGYRPAQPGFRRRDTGAVVTAAATVWFEPDGSAWAASPTTILETLS